MVLREGRVELMGGSFEKSGAENDVGGRIEAKGFRRERSTVLDDENDGRDFVEGGDSVGSFAFRRNGGREELFWSGGGNDDGGFGGDDASLSRHGRSRSDGSCWRGSKSGDLVRFSAKRSEEERIKVRVSGES